MKRTLAETKAAVVTVSGICNVGLSANLLFGALAASFERNLDVTVLKPYVLPKFGFQRPLRETLEDYHQYMAHVKRVYAHAGLVVVGHSLGGDIGYEEASASHSQQYLGTVALAAPLGKLDEQHWLIHRDRVREINALTEDLQADGTGLVQVGAEFDTIVPWTSALAEIPGSQRFLLQGRSTHTNRLAQALNHCGGNGVWEHNAMLHERKVVSSVTHVVGTMLERAGLPQSNYIDNLSTELTPYFSSSSRAAA